MRRRFVIEAVMIAIYGHLLVPSRSIEYVMPYSTIMELYDLQDGSERIMPDSEEDAQVKQTIDQMIRFFEQPFNRKKIDRALQSPWRMSLPLLVNDQVTFTIVNAFESEQYGEGYDPIETELILTAIRDSIPLITDQIEFEEKVLLDQLPVQIYDIEDFDVAMNESVISKDMELQ